MGNINIGEVIRTYIKLRNQKEAIEDEVKERVAAINIRLSKLEAFLKMQMDAQGLTNFKSEHGTAFISSTDYANVVDWDATLSFIRENEAYDMLEKSIRKLAVREYIKSNKAVPPGVNYGTVLKVSIRKPSAKMEE